MSNRQRVLIIDDTVANRYVLKKILSDEPGFEILEASNGAAGLELIDADVDLVIIDMNLPDMSGFELIEAAKEKLGGEKLPATISMSATFITGKDKAKGINQGAQAYLTHPINGDEVMATITSLLKTNRRFNHMRKQRNVAVEKNESLRSEMIMLERFMCSLSHDLRTPLTSASLVVNMMQENPGRRTDELLAMLSNNLHRINEMITNVLDISHMSMGGGLKLHGEEFMLQPLLDETVSNLQLQLARRLVVESTIGECPVFWDREGFLRIFDNLVVNASKHGQPDGPIHVMVATSSQYITLRVSNHGAMPENVLENLATPHFISTRSDSKGWGLGLPIVKALSESFGGSVDFRNEGNQVIVEVHLPRRIAGSV